jgi:outer membrane receptor protein involved in Fe transport
VARGAVAGALAPDLSVTNDFRFKQTINTAYATYERPFGDLTAQAGLRLEDVAMDLNQVTSGRKDSIGYFRAYPTLHLGYKLDDERKVSASYSRRVQRPPPFLLNPFPIFVDLKNIQQGNPRLKPQTTDSFELGYETRRGPTYMLATAYYRRNDGEFNYILRDLGNGTFLNTFDNLGSSRAIGLELVANGRFTPKLTYNISSNIYWSQISAANLGFAGRRSGYGIGGRANLSWQATPDDLLQLNAFAQGKRLQAQGFIEPVRIVNLGWRHKFDDRVTATVTVQDLLASNRFHRKFDTPVLREPFLGEPVSRAIFVRLDYRFGGRGGKPTREPGFEFENGAGPAP